MPQTLRQFRVFIVSPGGLEEERELFHKILRDYTEREAEPRKILFHPVGWEATLPGAGRPQAMINEDLKTCDYAVFLLHDRWGSPTGDGHTSGFAEEWDFAESLYKDRKDFNIALLFKSVTDAQVKDAGPQLTQVLKFRQEIESSKKISFRRI